MNALPIHQSAANCNNCGNGEPVGATCAFEELCETCQEGRCMDCGCENDTDYDFCTECLISMHLENVARNEDLMRERRLGRVARLIERGRHEARQQRLNAECGVR